MNAEPIPFKPEWPALDERLLRTELPDPPNLSLDEVFGRRWGSWIAAAAEAKAAPRDYVAIALLAVSGSLLGNTRWPSPWNGWAEPPIIWAMAIGSPSMNKSPGLDAVLGPLRKIEREERDRVLSVLSECRERSELAKLAEQTWKEQARAAIKNGETPPPKPDEATAEPEPMWQRLALTDTTIERLAVIVSKQPRGTLLARDELSGWLQNMARYTSGSSDRPFWLEAYGGRAYTVERMGRDPVYIDRLSVGVLGGIQPEKLKSLLLKTEDDGLLARLVPAWPQPAPITRPGAAPDDGFAEAALKRLLSLRMLSEPDGGQRPWLVPFSESARCVLDDFRLKAREWESGADGLLVSLTGKLPGLTVRLALILAYLDWAASEDLEPSEVSAEHYRRAAAFAETYVLPMARRAYAETSTPSEERAARRLCGLISEMGWKSFTPREVQRLERSGLRTKAELEPALEALIEGDVIRIVQDQPGTKGGRPSRRYVVNPALWRP